MTNECNHCVIADRGEAIFWGGFMIGLAVGLAVSVFLLGTGWLLPDKPRQVSLAAEKCYQNGKRAVLIHDEVRCR